MNQSAKPNLLKKRGWMRILVKWFLFAAGCLFAFLMLFCGIEHIWGKRALKIWKAEMRANGEKFTLEELNLPKLPKEGNGASALLDAAAQLKALTNCVIASGGMPTMRGVAPGKAMVLFEQRTIPNSSFYDGRQSASREWTDLSAELIRAKGLLEKIEMALKQPIIQVDLNYTEGFDMQVLHLGLVRNTARWFSAVALDDLHRRNLDNVLEDFKTLNSLEESLKNEHIIISQLVRLAVQAINQGLLWQLLQAEGWKDDQLREMQALWQKTDFVEDMTRSFEEERVMAILEFERCRHSSKHIMAILAPITNLSEENRSLNASENMIQRILRYLVFLPWQSAFSYHDELHYLKFEQNLIENSRLLLKKKSWITFSSIQNDRPTRSFNPYRFPFSGLIASDQKRAMLAAVRSEVCLELAVTAIALKRYQLHYGRLPNHLGLLVPEFLPKLPMDYMDGKPLRYHANIDGTFKLYSVGEDGKDDGGNPNPSDPNSDSRRGFLSWYGRDQVWPSRASKEEVAAYESSLKKK